MSEQSETQNLQDELVAAVDTGARSPHGAVGKFIGATAFTWGVGPLGPPHADSSSVASTGQNGESNRVVCFNIGAPHS